MTTWRDPLAVRPARQTRAEFGGESRRITSLRTSSALNNRPRASLRLAASVDPPLDYLAELRISTTAGPSEYIMFTGFVDSAAPDGGEVRIEALSATELSEQTVGSLVTSGVPAPNWYIC